MKNFYTTVVLLGILLNFNKTLTSDSVSTERLGASSSESLDLSSSFIREVQSLKNFVGTFYVDYPQGLFEGSEASLSLSFSSDEGSSSLSSSSKGSPIEKLKQRVSGLSVGGGGASAGEGNTMRSPGVSPIKASDSGDESDDSSDGEKLSTKEVQAALSKVKYNFDVIYDFLKRNDQKIPVLKGSVDCLKKIKNQKHNPSEDSSDESELAYFIWELKNLGKQKIVLAKCLEDLIALQNQKQKAIEAKEAARLASLTPAQQKRELGGHSLQRANLTFDSKGLGRRDPHRPGK